jgi:hypothetical protein
MCLKLVRNTGRQCFINRFSLAHTTWVTSGNSPHNEPSDHPEERSRPQNPVADADRRIVRSQPRRLPAPTGPGGQPLQSRDSAHGRGLILAVAAMVAVGGWILWNAARASTERPTEVKLGTGYIPIFNNDTELAKRVIKDGPRLYPGLGGTEADFWLNTVNGQWFAFAARKAGTGRECNVVWKADKGQFAAPCENNTLYSPTGKGLPQYEVIVDDHTVAVRLAPGDPQK